MTDYKCDICGKKATVHITKFVDGHKLKFHLCEACSKDNKDKLKSLIETQIALKTKKDFNVEEVLDEMLSGVKQAPAGLVCPHCKSTFESFEKATKVACEHCYDAFSSKFDEILGQMHLANTHKGKGVKAPLASGKLAKKDFDIQEDSFELKEEATPFDAKASLAKLSEELELAIEQERYEDAAVLRDKIESLK